MGKRYRLLPTLGFIVALGFVGVFASLATADGDAKTSVELERALVVKPKDGKLAKPSGRKAFIVAADDYGANATALPGARNDGEAFYKRLLEIGFEEENVVFLRSGGGFADYPTKANIEKRFQSFIENLRPDDFVIVYLSGHGIQPTDSDEAFFAPIDVEPNRPFETAVSLDAMLTALEGCEAKFRWVIVDACRNDPRNPERAIFTTRATGARALSKIENAPDSVALMQSCQPGACAYEGGVGEAREIESGFFTLGLLEALDPEESKADANRDGVLSFSETFQYVSTRTNELATKYYGKSQKPSLSGSIVDFALLDGLLIDGLTRTDWESANELAREARELRFEGLYDDAMKKIDAALRIKSDDKELETAKKEIAEILKNRAEAERVRREAQEKAQAALDAANAATEKAEAALKRAEQAGADAAAKAEAEREAREAAEAKKRAEEALAELNAEENEANETSVEEAEEPEIIEAPKAANDSGVLSRIFASTRSAIASSLAWWRSRLLSGSALIVWGTITLLLLAYARVHRVIAVVLEANLGLHILVYRDLFIVCALASGATLLLVGVAVGFALPEALPWVGRYALTILAFGAALLLAGPFLLIAMSDWSLWGKRGASITLLVGEFLGLAYLWPNLPACDLEGKIFIAKMVGVLAPLGILTMLLLEKQDDVPEWLTRILDGGNCCGYHDQNFTGFTVLALLRIALVLATAFIWSGF